MRSMSLFGPENWGMAARMIDTDTTPHSSLALCHVERGGCGWRSPVYVSKAKAQAAADAHRAAAHPELVTAAAAKAAARQLVSA